MNKPEYVHYDTLPLVRSMSPRTERELNNIPLMTREEIAEELAKKHLKKVNMGILQRLYLNDLDKKSKNYMEQLEYIEQIYKESGLSTAITPYPKTYMPEFRVKQIFDTTKFTKITSKGDNN